MAKGGAAATGGRGRGGGRGRVSGNTPARGQGTPKRTGRGASARTTIAPGRKPNKAQVRFARGAMQSRAGRNYLNETGRGG